ncbi:hypothetical protein QE152_g25618 [Popillia japonica]|uniref:Uncharacterized protein n=1 Tax=Popillia japonica TaxID=7064 RepID=A0AAW1K010_POPJA
MRKNRKKIGILEHGTTRRLNGKEEELVDEFEKTGSTRSTSVNREGMKRKNNDTDGGYEWTREKTKQKNSRHLISRLHYNLVEISKQVPPRTDNNGSRIVSRIHKKINA